MSAWIMALLLQLKPVDFIRISLPVELWIVFRLLASFCGVFGFSIMFNSPIRLASASAVIGAAANTLRLELVDLAGMPPAAARNAKTFPKIVHYYVQKPEKNQGIPALSSQKNCSRRDISLWACKSGESAPAPLHCPRKLVKIFIPWGQKAPYLEN